MDCRRTKSSGAIFSTANSTPRVSNTIRSSKISRISFLESKLTVKEEFGSAVIKPV